jgi:hypothetical protein
MSQSTLDDDELFGEAASEVRADVEEGLANARDALPDPDAIWDLEADNTLGVLNGLRSALDVGEVEEDLRDAKKWYTMGERADAFGDGSDLEAEIQRLDDLLAEVDAAREQVGELASTIPELKTSLEDAAAASEESDPEPDADGGAEAEA